MAKKYMSSITTKTGDQGETSLANGQRVAKDSLVMQVMGDVDELNSHLGMVISHLAKSNTKQIKFLTDIQRHLYELSALLAKSPQKINFKDSLKLLENELDKLETEVSAVMVKAFLYPGGVLAAAQLDVARSVCRRAERSLVSLNQQQPVELAILAYLNRLSDYLYLLKIKLNHLAKQPASRLSLKKD